MNIKFTIDRFEGETAVLKTPDGKTVLWPKNILPENSRAGMMVDFSINAGNKTGENNKKLAKEILNEILETQE